MKISHEPHHFCGGGGGAGGAGGLRALVGGFELLPTGSLGGIGLEPFQFGLLIFLLPFIFHKLYKTNIVTINQDTINVLICNFFSVVGKPYGFH